MQSHGKYGDTHTCDRLLIKMESYYSWSYGFLIHYGFLQQLVLVEAQYDGTCLKS